MKVLVILALCLAGALRVKASVCTDICNGVCTISNTACELAVILNPLCKFQNGICTQACTEGCGCVDGCEASCGPDLKKCQEDNKDNVLALATCTDTFETCTELCGTKCLLEIGDTKDNDA